jgi:hypothetical protein
MKKKGVFFTFMALFVVILIIAVVSTHDKYTYREKSQSISARMKTMNNFVHDLEGDINRGLFIGGYRALLSMNVYVRLTEEYVSDFDWVFTQILVNGTIDEYEMELMTQDGQGADITSWLSRVNEEAGLLDINVDMIVNSISVRHTSPWDIEIVLDARINISDRKGLASWVIEKEYTNGFSILGFEDPLYTIGTSDKVSNLINKTPYTEFITPGNDTSALYNHLMNSYYVNTTTAPSFLMRFAGDLSPSEYGIESMVDLEVLNSQNLPIYARSLIDYVYFGTQATTDYCNVKDMPTWFRIDTTNAVFYGVDALKPPNC